MWVVKEDKQGELYLTWDKNVRRNWYNRGIWESIGAAGNSLMPDLIRINQANGLLCCKDDQGQVRVFVCAD
jgi:hypothetical protein